MVCILLSKHLCDGRHAYKALLLPGKVRYSDAIAGTSHTFHRDCKNVEATVPEYSPAVYNHQLFVRQSIMKLHFHTAPIMHVQSHNVFLATSMVEWMLHLQGMYHLA